WGTQSTARKLEWEHPCTRSERQIRKKWSRPEELPRFGFRLRIEIVEDGKHLVWLMPGVAHDEFTSCQGILWGFPGRSHRRTEHAVAHVGFQSCDARRQNIGERGEVRHRRCLGAVESIQNRYAVVASLQINEVVHV